MSARPRFSSVDEYLASVPPEARRILERIRRIVKRAVPAAEERISYQMPAFRLGRVFVYYAAFKSHIGLYPPVRGDRELARDLSRYLGEKGNLKFPLDEPMPYDLIERVVAALARQYASR